jgi:uncharacterized protein (DUF2252 family)
LACLLGPPIERGIAPSAPTRDAQWLPAPPGTIPPALTKALVANPYAFFRLVNRAWASRVCAAFANDLPSLPPVRLHGDAHVEQYAITDGGYGLDDFDDTSEGPPVIDLVRFLGSLRLAARERGWSSEFDRLASGFLAGYQQGLNATAGPHDTPRFVRRLRQRKIRDQAAFLAWAEALMMPVTPDTAQATRQALNLLGSLMTTGADAKPAGYFQVKRVGRVDLGIGSRRLPKLLIRIEGPSAAAHDDVILEAKQPANLTGIECLAPARQTDAIRVITGAQQIGRLKHDVLSMVPNLIEKSGVHHWWVHDWTPSYMEISITDLRSVGELSELARDAGRQLGGAGVPRNGTAALEQRQKERRAVAALDARLRQVTVQLTDDLLKEWQSFRARSRPD